MVRGLVSVVLEPPQQEAFGDRLSCLVGWCHAAQDNGNLAYPSSSCLNRQRARRRAKSSQDTITSRTDAQKCRPARLPPAIDDRSEEQLVRFRFELPPTASPSDLATGGGVDGREKSLVLVLTYGDDEKFGLDISGGGRGHENLWFRPDLRHARNYTCRGVSAAAASNLAMPHAGTQGRLQ